MRAADSTQNLGGNSSDRRVLLGRLTQMLQLVLSLAILVTLEGLEFSLAEAKHAHDLAQVHVVGLYQAGREVFETVGHDDIDWLKFCAKLVPQANGVARSPSKRVWELLPETARAVAKDNNRLEKIHKLIQNRREGKKPPNMFDAVKDLQELKSGLTKVLQSRDFYQDPAFKNVNLDQECKSLIKRHADLSNFELFFLNRRLLETTFGDAVKKSKFNMEQATVRVRVVATKEPIILVLCSYNSVRWVIQEDKGAKLQKVIVGGNHTQHATGTKAPTSYYVYEPAKSGTLPDYFYAYKKDNVNYPKMVDAVKRLTGKDISSFQGRSTYDGKTPFIVGAKE